MKLTANNKILDLSKPQVMGIVNMTPDSFSDGGRFNQLDKALRQIELMIAAGASIIDIGGESTRPGAAAVSSQDELQRVIPLIKAVRSHFDIWISLDSSKAAVMSEGVNAGIDIINDIRSLQQQGALEVAVQAKLPVCIMHMQGQPSNMQAAPVYQDVVAEVKASLQLRMDECIAAGMSKSQLILDPGFGFGKSLAHNYQLLAHLDEFHTLGAPILAGMSRKSMVSKLLGIKTEQSMVGSVACATVAAMKGAQIIRVHDVVETYQAMQVVDTINHCH